MSLTVFAPLDKVLTFAYKTPNGFDSDSYRKSLYIKNTTESLPNEIRAVG